MIKKLSLFKNRDDVVDTRLLFIQTSPAVDNYFADRLRTRKGVALVILLVALVATGIYLPALRYELTGEDRLLAGSREWPDKIRGVRPADDELPVVVHQHRQEFRPITRISFLIDAGPGTNKPWLSHLINLLLNTMTAVMVVLIIWESLHSAVWAGFAGLLFATHPSHVAAVVCVSARAEILVALFLSLAGFALLRTLRKRDWRWLPLVPVGFALALGSKESALFFPLLVLLTPFFAQSRVPKGFLWVMVSLLVIAGLYLYLRSRFSFPVLPGAVTPEVMRLIPAPPVSGQFFNTVNTIGFYIRMFVWPFEHRLLIPADPNFLKLNQFSLYLIVFLVVIPLAALRRRFRIALWGYFWTLAFLNPIATVTPAGEQAAEQILFLPSVGLVVVAVVLLSRLLVAYHRTREVVGFLLAGVCGLFAWNSVSRLAVWQNDQRLFSAMIKEAPAVPTGYAGLARSLEAVLPDSAIKLYNRAILIDQGYVAAHLRLARLYSDKKDHRRALHHLRLADELRPGDPEIQTRLGFTLLRSGNNADAIAAFNRALAIDSNLVQPIFGIILTQIVSERKPPPGLIDRLNQLLPEWRDSLKTVARQLGIESIPFRP